MIRVSSFENFTFSIISIRDKDEAREDRDKDEEKKKIRIIRLKRGAQILYKSASFKYS